MFRDVLQMDLQQTPTAKRQRIDYGDKEPFSDLEICATRIMNQPKLRQIITELVMRPRHDITGVNNLTTHPAVTQAYQSEAYMDRLCDNASKNPNKQHSVVNPDQIVWEKDLRKTPSGLSRDPKTNPDRWNVDSRKFTIDGGNQNELKRDLWMWQDSNKDQSAVNQDPKENQDKKKLGLMINQDKSQDHDPKRNHKVKLGLMINQDKSQDHDPKRNHKVKLGLMKTQDESQNQDPKRNHGELDLVLQKTPSGLNQDEAKNRSKSAPSLNKDQVVAENHDLQTAYHAPLVEEKEVAEQESTFTCNSCGRTGPDMLLCAGCYGNYYCNEKCQSRDWDQHQHWCSSE